MQMRLPHYCDLAEINFDARDVVYTEMGLRGETVIVFKDSSKCSVKGTPDQVITAIRSVIVNGRQD